MPFTIYNVRDVDNTMTVDGIEKPIYEKSVFPNQDVKVCRSINPYRQMSSSEVNNLGLNNVRQDIIEWSKEGQIRNELRNSLRGYIYMVVEGGDENGADGVIMINNNGTWSMDSRDLATFPNRTNLPVIRYILPIPQSVIDRSHGRYENKYGYTNS